MSTANPLSSRQAHALFDILTSHLTLTEIENLKLSKTVTSFGPPLQLSLKDESSSPLLRVLLQSFVLDLPGLRNVTPSFWTDSIRQLATALDDSNLSESYDKGSVGIRRTLSTATASIVESVARGRLGGYPRHAPNENIQYDQANPEHVIQAWDDFLQQIIYGDLLDKMFTKTAETDKLADHEPIVQAAHQYALIILASLLHHNLIVSPRGQSMISLLNRFHRLTPYFLVKQTLKVGNAASMLNGMSQLLLAKMNLSTITSWFGAQQSDSGMNLLQQIISQVLSAEITELKKRAKAAEQSPDCPSKSQLEQLRNYASKTIDEQKKLRNVSQSHSLSIATAIFSPSPSQPISLSTSTHILALDYLSIQLSIQDRSKIIRVLCHNTPDHLTTSIRTLVKVYEPIIRALHNAVDLAAGVTDLQNFLDDLIALSLLDTKPSDNKGEKKKVPTVQDFVHLLQKHQKSSHVFLHQALKNGKELSEWYHEYAIHAINQYKQQHAPSSSSRSVSTNPPPPTPKSPETFAGDFTPMLNTLISSLPAPTLSPILNSLDQYATYLSHLSQRSKQKMSQIVRASLNPSSSSSSSSHERKTGSEEGNPGMFLHKWQHYIDTTIITPGAQGGAVRKGGDGSVKEATSVGVEGGKAPVVVEGSKGNEKEDEGEEEEKLEMPDTLTIIQLLSSGFRDEVQKMVDTKKGDGG